MNVKGGTALRCPLLFFGDDGRAVLEPRQGSREAVTSSAPD